VLNAANEIAVEAFLAGTIRFTAIHSVNARTLDRLQPQLGPATRWTICSNSTDRRAQVAVAVMQELARDHHRAGLPADAGAC
jgi:1-deoxy-D-xylulose-5-phosphate reductoisomerase